MTVSIIIPAYNEGKTIKELILRVRKAICPIEKEIIVIDDGSFDKTREILEELKNQLGFILIRHQKNQGKGAAVKTGFLVASGDIILIQDADLEYQPADYPRLIKPILEKKAEVVFSSRFHEEFANKIVYRHGYYFCRFLNLFSNFLSGLKLKDVYSGYKVFSRTALKTILPCLTARRFGIEPEIAAQVAKHHLAFAEVNINYQGRTYQQGKKINWKDGIAALWHIIYFNLFSQ